MFTAGLVLAVFIQPFISRSSVVSRHTAALWH